MIEIKDYKLNDMIINYNIDQSKRVGIYSINHQYTKQILLQIAGINNSSSIFYNNSSVYDNKTYFKERLFIDGNKKITNTLLAPFITKTLIKKYTSICNENLLKEYINKLQIRSEGKLKILYRFTKEGIALTNNVIALSTYKYPILYTPLENISLKKRRDYLVNEYQNKSFLVGITNLSVYKEIVDEVLFITNNSYFILSSSQLLLCFKNTTNILDSMKELDIMKNIIYMNEKNIIIQNNLSLYQIRQLNKLNIVYQTIKALEIGEYI